MTGTRIDPPTSADAAGLSLHEKIDVARGLFAALVIMAHSLEISWGVHRGAREGLGYVLGETVFGVFGTGTYYVMGFFVLSGYCIQLSVSRAIEEGRFTLRQYLLARLTRILPLYYPALLSAVAVEWVISGARPYEWPHGLNLADFLGQLVMVQYLTQTFGSFASSWSMTHEVVYYLLFGLLAWALAGRGHGPVRPARVGMVACLVAAAVGQGLYATVTRNLYVYRVGMVLGLGMLWFQGALVATYGRGWMERGWVRRLAAWWPAVVAFAIAWKTAHMPPQGLYLFSGFGFTLMLLDFHRGGPVRPPATAGRWRRGVVATLGLASYPTYLFHGPILMLAGSVILRWQLIADWRVTWAVLLVLGLTTGAAMGWLLERPTMAWRAALLKRPGAAGGVPAPSRAAASRPAAVAAGA